MNLQENIRRILREEFNNKYLYHGTSYDNAINMIENGFNQETYWGGMETAKEYAYSYDQPTLIKVKKNEIVDLLEPNYSLIDYYKDNLEYDEDYQEIIDEWEKSDKNVEDSLRIFDSVILFPSYLSISKKNIIRL